MSIEILQELHRIGQPSDGITPEVIRDMTIEQACRLAQDIPPPLAGLGREADQGLGGRCPAATCAD